jgi:4'-phosphopantetheinyl transferase
MKVTGRGRALSPDKFTLSVTPDVIMLDHEGPRPEYVFRELPCGKLPEGECYCAAFCLKGAPETHSVKVSKIDLGGENDKAV